MEVGSQSPPKIDTVGDGMRVKVAGTLLLAAALRAGSAGSQLKPQSIWLDSLFFNRAFLHCCFSEKMNVP
jgi:hypothetical protein